MNKRVLLIAFHYPPVRGSSGIQRTLKFSAYLREHGWEPLVLTVNPRAYEQVSDDQLGEIPQGMAIERAWALDTARHLAIAGRYPQFLAQPDRWVSWWPDGVRRGMSLVRRYRPAAMMSTYPIATAHLIGLTLRRLTRLPWVADFRDSMTEPGYPRDPFTWRVHRRLERAVMRHCARAVFTTTGTLAMYRERYPEIDESRFAVVENGFDEENFVDAETNLERKPLGAPGQVTLLHSGILYPEERDPRPFFAALRLLRDRGEIDARRLRVVLRATGSDALYTRMIADQGLAGIVELAPIVGYRDALQEMLRADGLLLFQATMCNHQIPAKLYEYLRAGRPVLGLTDPSGNTAVALRAAGLSDIADIADASNIAEVASGFLRRLAAGERNGALPEVAAAHSRRARTAGLARLLDGLV